MANKAQLLREADDHFLLSDGKEFRVPKDGLSEATLQRIRSMQPTAEQLAARKADTTNYADRENADLSTLAVMPAGEAHGDANAPVAKIAEMKQALAAPPAPMPPQQTYTQRAKQIATEAAMMVAPPAIATSAQQLRGFADGGTVPPEYGVSDAGADPFALPPPRGAPQQVDMRGQPVMPASPGGFDTLMEGGRKVLAEPTVLSIVNPALGAIANTSTMSQNLRDEVAVPGVVARGSTPPREDVQQPQQVPPPPGVRPRGAGGVGAPNMSEMDKSGTEQKAAIDAQAAAQSAQTQALAGAQVDGVKRLEAAQAEDRATRQRAHDAGMEDSRKLQEASDEMKRVDVSVDPGRFWASRTTGQKIMGIIGLALGSIGAGNDGINRAAGMLNQAIDRDIDAQKAEHDARLRKAGANLENVKTMYGIHRGILNDDIAGAAAAKVTALEITNARIEAIKLATSDPVQKAQFQGLQAKLGEELFEKKALIKDRAIDTASNAQLRAAETQKALAEAGKAGAAGGLSPKQADTVTEIEGYHRNVQKNGAKLLALIDKYNTSEEGTPGVETQMRQLAADMATDVAKMKDPNSAARESEVEAEMKNIFTPGWWQRKSGAVAGLKSYIDNARQRRDIAYQVRGLRSPQ